MIKILDLRVFYLESWRWMMLIYGIRDEVGGIYLVVIICSKYFSFF